MTSEFDAHAKDYRQQVERSIDFIGADLDFFTDVKARLLVELARDRLGPTKNLSVLDIGCGAGVTDGFLEGVFGSLEGVDVSEAVIQQAARDNPWVRYRTYDGRHLPIDDDSVDICFAISVLHHVSPSDRRAFTVEMARVVSPGGLVVLFEHNPFNPLTRLAVSRCDFDEGVVLVRKSAVRSYLRLAGLKPVDDRYIVFFPWKGQAFRTLERGLGWLALGAQYVVAGRR